MYVVDTQSLIWYILKRSHSTVRDIFKSSENGLIKIYIPTIVLAEIFYIVKKRKIKLDYQEMLTIIEENPNFIIVGFSYEVLKTFFNIGYFDLHDQIIVATTKLLGATLITTDREIIMSNIVRTLQ